MKDPNDCTYPHTRLCLHNCKYGCAKRSPERSGWRKVQIDDAEEKVWNTVTALKEQLAQLEQEPVAGHIGWLVRNSQGKLDLLTELQIDSSLEKYERLHKLYTHPPQRTWVGLTEQEALDCFSPNPVTHSKNVEAKLKEKNT